MKYYLKYITYHSDTRFQLIYKTDKIDCEPNALEFLDALKMLQMHKIPFTTDMSEYRGKKTQYILIKQSDLKKISRILINDTLEKLLYEILP